MNVIYERDIIQAALFFNYCANESTMLKKEEVDNYSKAFINDLNDRSIDYRYEYIPNDEPIYFYENDRENNGYYIINSDSFLDSYDLWHNCGLGTCSLEVLFSYQAPEVLKMLGIEIMDDKSISRKKVISLSRK